MGKGRRDDDYDYDDNHNNNNNNEDDENDNYSDFGTVGWEIERLICCCRTEDFSAAMQL